MATNYERSCAKRLEAYLVRKKASLEYRVKSPSGGWKSGAFDVLKRELTALGVEMRDASPATIAEYAITFGLMVQYLEQGTSVTLARGVRIRAEKDLATCESVQHGIDQDMPRAYDPAEREVFDLARTAIHTALCRLHS